MKALVVEKSRMMRQMHGQILARMGFTTVVEARDGLDALRALETLEPDLVLTSWHLPGVDGIGLIRRVRAEGRSMPVIMVTAESDEGSREEALKSGATGYVSKPFTPDLLRQRIEEALLIRAV